MLDITKNIQLYVISAEKELFSDLASKVIVTGAEGELGIFPGHLQLLTTIKPGQVKIFDTKQNMQLFYLSGGILEVQPNIVTILADTAIRAEDIDENATISAKKRAEEIISSKDKKSIDYQTALIAISEASAKLRVIKELAKLRR